MENKRNVKKSKYNIFVPFAHDKFIVYNPFSGAIGTFDSDTMERFNSDSLTKEETDVLIRKGIYVSSTINEIDIINRDRVNGIFSSYKNYRIWSTSACNARCYYCFEKGIPTLNMTEATADTVVDFICSLVNEGDSVSIEWFGGEPLLNVKIIDYISKKISIYFDEQGIPWHASMISNGSLVTPDIIQRMKEQWKIQGVQITLDGYGENYNQTKKYINPTAHNFESVIQNIKMLLDNDVHVSIRMNYDTINYNSLKELIAFLGKEFSNRSNISFYVYPIWDALCGGENSFTTATVADKKLIDLFEDLVSKGMATASILARLQYRKRQCSACGINSFSILPNGDILKCSEAFNCVVGNVCSGIIDENSAIKWTDPGLDEDCLHCTYLPLCQGGCRASRVTNMPRCSAFKSIIPELLEWYIKHAKKTS